ncbi:hypothetical protein D929_00103 [Enterococcus faecalis 02-MB-P-10]|uniref:hypothetical protein n=1 Tax=Enterococcus faecalis TaxID=1351 RepID=UPI00035353B3|nr:hypothetical protein [Enterococcus faecalis]EPH77373.1 hypothetical protein D929_00103 [Enterococcus faecalis 02-MB-P-10]
MLINSFFLKKKEQHKIKMLYEIKNNSFITIDDLKSLFSISEYKAKALINDVRKDIHKSGYGEKFRFFSRAIFCISIEGIDMLIQEIVNAYYRESQYVRFIIEYALLNNQVSVISEKVHISISKSYNIKRILQKITLENVSLSRENKEIFYRKLLFTIFSNSTDLLWEYSCKNVDDFLNEVLFVLKDIFIVRLTDKRMRSIKIILLIIYYRVKYGFEMNKGIFNLPSTGNYYESRIDDLLRLPISKKLKIGRDDFFFIL